MKTNLMTRQEVISRLEEGKPLLIAADHDLLKSLPKGNWIGGSIPYFMTEDGGRKVLDLFQVTTLPPEIIEVSIRTYGPNELAQVPRDYKSNGLSFIIIPAFSEAHNTFANECTSWNGVFDRPLVGWVSGNDVESGPAQSPIVVNGTTLEFSSTDAVVLHANLMPNIFARANIINLFERGTGDSISFDDNGFEIQTCRVNGQVRDFAAYLTESGTDTRLPLVADYLGASINVAIRSINVEENRVQLFAPVFSGVEYRVAKPVEDYEAEFKKRLSPDQIGETSNIFACNCILNYMYANLNGKRTGDFLGPMTFGEIAYMLLNQTLVYVTLDKRKDP